MLLELLVLWLVGIPVLVLGAGAIRAHNRSRWLGRHAGDQHATPPREREAA